MIDYKTTLQDLLNNCQEVINSHPQLSNCQVMAYESFISSPNQLSLVVSDGYDTIELGRADK